ncbi:hypothetical protein AGIG_G6673 [Arapaima gigas]
MTPLLLLLLVLLLLLLDHSSSRAESTRRRARAASERCEDSISQERPTRKTDVSIILGEKLGPKSGMLNVNIGLQ